MVRPERVRVSMDAPTGDVATVRATVRDLTFQGPVVRLSLAAPDDSTIVAHVGPEQDLPMLRPGDEVHVCWAPDASLVLPAADIPDHRGSRGDARRLVSGRPSIRSLSSEIHERHSRHAPKNENRSPAPLPPCDQPDLAPALHRRRCRGRSGGGHRPVLPGRMRQGRRRAPATTTTAGGPGQRHVADLELAAVHGRRLRRRLPEGVRAHRGLQGRLQRQRAVVRQGQGAAVAQAGHRRGPRGAHPVHGRPH